MPSSVYLAAFASHPEILGDEAMIWELGDWYDPQQDEGLGATTDITMTESGFIVCPDGSYGAGVDSCPPAAATGQSTQCGANEVLVSSPDWAAPVCMTANMALSYGAGLQAQKAAAPLLGIPSSAIPWLIGGAAVLLLAGFGGGRRR